MKKLAIALVLVCAAACQKPMTAMTACKRIEAAGVGANCKEGKPGGLGAAAVDAATFDLPSVPGKTAQVLHFDREEFFSSTETAYGNAALLAGPHRYGSKKTLVFVQANEGLSLEEGRKLKAVVDAL